MSARNTATHRLCPNCKGTGEIIRNDSASGDPQTEYPVMCGANGCVEGWIRCVPVDPIEELAFARRRARIPGAHAMRYGELRARVTTDVALPVEPAQPTHAWPQAA